MGIAMLRFRTGAIRYPRLRHSSTHGNDRRPVVRCHGPGQDLISEGDCPNLDYVAIPRLRIPIGIRTALIRSSSPEESFMLTVGRGCRPFARIF
jgi:hypothetical protein